MRPTRVNTESSTSLLPSAMGTWRMGRLIVCVWIEGEWSGYGGMPWGKVVLRFCAELKITVSLRKSHIREHRLTPAVP